MCNCKTIPWQPLFDDNMIVKESYIDPNIDRNLVRVAYRHVENTLIDGTLGRCLYTKLLELMCDGTLGAPGNEYYATLAMQYLFPVVVYGIQAELPINTTLRQTNAGVVQSTDNEHYRGASLDETKAQTEFYRTRTDFYILELQKYLRCNHNGFPEFYGCGQVGCNCQSPLLNSGARTTNGIYTGRAARSRTYLRPYDERWDRTIILTKRP